MEGLDGLSGNRGYGLQIGRGGSFWRSGVVAAGGYRQYSAGDLA